MATYYWYGGSGNWTDYTNHWSTNSGNSPAAPAPNAPTSADDVVFDANSGTGTVTINGLASCRNFSMATSSLLTVAGSSELDVYGNFTLKAGITWSHSNYLKFKATTTVSLDYQGVFIQSYIYIDGVGGVFNQASDIDTYTSYGGRTFNMVNGTYNTNNYKFWLYGLGTSGSAACNLNLGTSTVKFAGSGISIYNNNLVIDADQCTLFQSDWTMSLGGSASSTFGDITIAVGAHSQGGVSFDPGVAGRTFNNVYIKPASTSYNYHQMTVAKNFTVNGTLTFQNWTQAVRLLLISDSYNTQRTITAAAISGFSYISFRDIVAAGTSAPWSGTSIGDAGNNSQINFATPRTLYWVGNGGSWSNNAKWSLSSGGAGGQDIPLPQDTVIIDRAGVFNAAQTVSVNVRCMGKNIDCSDVQVAFTLSMNTGYNYSYGSFKGNTLMTITGQSYYGWTHYNEGGSFNFDGSAVSCAVPISIYARGTSPACTIQANFSTASYLYIYWYSSGSLNLNGKTIKGASITIGAQNSSQIDLTWGGATLEVTNTTGGGFMYYNIVTQDTTGGFKFSGAAGNKSLNFSGSTAKVIPQVDFTGAGQLTVYPYDGNNHQITTFNCTQGGVTVKVQNGYHLKVQTFNVNGVLGSPTTLASGSTNSKMYLDKVTAGLIQCDYLTIIDSQAAGGDFMAGKNSTLTRTVGWKLGVQYAKTATAKAKIKVVGNKTSTAKARIKSTGATKTATAKARIKIVPANTAPSVLGSPTSGYGDTIPHTVAAGTDVLVVAVGLHQGTINGVYWDGDLMTQADWGDTYYHETAHIWYLPNPGVKSANIGIDASGGSGLMAVIMNLTGVGNTTPENHAHNDGDSSGAYVDYQTLQDNALIIECEYSEPVPDGTPNNATLVATLQDQSYENLEVTKKYRASATTQTISHDLSYGGRWAVAAASWVGVTKNTKTGTAKAKIKVITLRTKTATAKARLLAYGVVKTAAAKADIRKTDVTKTATAKARIKTANHTKTATAKARIKYLIAKTATAKANIRKIMYWVEDGGDWNGKGYAERYIDYRDGYYDDFGNAGNLGVGQALTIRKAGKLKQLKFYLSKDGNPTGTLYAKVYAVTGTVGTDAVPTGAPLAVSDAVDIVTADIQTGDVFKWITFNFSGLNQIDIAKNGNYAVVVEWPDMAGDGSNHLKGGAGTANLYGNQLYPNGSGGWSYYATWSECFYIICENDGNHWALTSGGVASGLVPDQNTEVIFDENSFSTDNQEISIDHSAYYAYCRSFDSTNVTHLPTLVAPDVWPSYAWYVDRDFKFYGIQVGSGRKKLYLANSGTPGTYVFEAEYPLKGFDIDANAWTPDVIYNLNTDLDTSGGLDVLGANLSDGVVEFSGCNFNSNNHAIKTGEIDVWLGAEYLHDYGTSIITVTEDGAYFGTDSWPADNTGLADTTLNVDITPGWIGRGYWMEIDSSDNIQLGDINIISSDVEVALVPNDTHIYAKDVTVYADNDINLNDYGDGYEYHFENFTFTGSANGNLLAPRYNTEGDPPYFATLHVSGTANIQNAIIQSVHVGTGAPLDAGTGIDGGYNTGFIFHKNAGYLRSTGGKLPGTVSQSNNGYSDWANIDNVKADDGNYATVTLVGGYPTNMGENLRCTNFNFNVPSNAKIVGVQIEVKGHDTVGTWFGTRWHYNGDDYYSDGVRTGTFDIGVDAWKTAGGQYDLYDWTDFSQVTLTPDIVNDPNFGISIYPGFTLNTTSVDAVLMYVYYVVQSNNSATAKARIYKLGTTKTGTAKARIETGGVTKTATAKAHIKVVNTKTATAKARVKKLFAKTATALARIKKLFAKTATAKARIKPPFTTYVKTGTAKARIMHRHTQTAVARARVKNTYPKTGTAKARIETGGVAKTATVKARIKKLFAKTATAKARLVNLRTKLATAKARIKKLVAKTVQAKARIIGTLTKTVTVKARIKTGGVVKTATSKGRVKQRMLVTGVAQARIKVAGETVTATSKARILRRLSKTSTARAFIRKPFGGVRTYLYQKPASTPTTGARRGIVILPGGRATVLKQKPVTVILKKR